MGNKLNLGDRVTGNCSCCNSIVNGNISAIQTGKDIIVRYQVEVPGSKTRQHFAFEENLKKIN